MVESKYVKSPMVCKGSFDRHRWELPDGSMKTLRTFPASLRHPLWIPWGTPPAGLRQPDSAPQAHGPRDPPGREAPTVCTT
jgi:hypothetical protein